MSLLACPPSSPARRPRLILYKALFLFSIALVSLLLPAARPVQAQGGGYYASPCDSKGNLLSNVTPDSNGFYTMSETESGTVTNTYPVAMVAALKDPSGNYSQYAGAAWPLAYTSLTTPGYSYQTSGIGGYPYYVQANNYSYTGSGNTAWFSVPASYGSPNSGLINGGLKVNFATGQLFYYFLVQWQGYGATPPPFPNQISLLLKTNVSASASVNYALATQTSGLTAQSSASDGPPFNESASASANSALVPNSAQLVVGYHLVTASVDPKTHIAQVYLNGTASYQANNGVPYGVVMSNPNYPGYSWVQQTNGPTTASASAYVQCGVKTDNRSVSITSSDIETSSFKGAMDVNHPNGVWPEVRPSDGSATTDSAVSPPPSQPGSVNAWLSSPTLLGQAPGFASPVFAWSMTGDGTLSASGNTSHTQLSVSFPTSSTGPALNKQSKVRLDVTDTGAITGANTFTVRWHYPYENWAASGAQFQNSPIAFPSTGPPQAVGGQVSIPVTAEASGITLNMAGKILGGILTTGGAVIAIAQPETDPLWIAFLTSTGYTLSVQDPPPTPLPFIESGTPGQFQTDVGTEMSIISGNTAGIFLPARPRMDPALAQAASTSGNYASYTGDQGGTLTFAVTAYREQMQQNYTGDSYGQRGYLGPGAGSVTWGGPWMNIWDWFWTPTVVPPSH